MDGVLDGRYQLEQEIAQGAIGAVWRAVDLVTGDAVAVKVLRPDTAAEPELVSGFVVEGKILATLDHFSVVRHRDFVTHDDRHALVMDLVVGEDLRRRLRRGGPVPPAVAANLVAQVADVLSYLHDRGVVHGDIKPGNLVVPADGGPIRLIDFGAAHAAAIDGGADRVIHATPEYVAPEIVVGARPSPASDVYALGIVLFELLCGRSPYRGGSSMDVLGRHGSCTPVPPPGLPSVVWPMIEECLAIDPGQRPEARLISARLRGVEPALDGASALPAIPADEVTWWPRPAGATTAVAKVSQLVAWVPLQATPASSASAYARPMVAVPIAVVGFEPERVGAGGASGAPVLGASATSWPSVSGRRSGTSAPGPVGQRPGPVGQRPGPAGPAGRKAGGSVARPLTPPPGPARRPSMANGQLPGSAGQPRPQARPGARRRMVAGMGMAAATVVAVFLAAPLLIGGRTGGTAPAGHEVVIPATAPAGDSPATAGPGKAGSGAKAGTGAKAAPGATVTPGPAGKPGMAIASEEPGERPGGGSESSGQPGPLVVEVPATELLPGVD